MKMKLLVRQKSTQSEDSHWAPISAQPVPLSVFMLLPYRHPRKKTFTTVRQLLNQLSVWSGSLHCAHFILVFSPMREEGAPS